MKSRIALSIAALGLGMALSTPAAAAISWFSPITVFEDDNLDYFVDKFNSGNVACGGATGVTCNGLLDVGDVFVSIAEWNQTAAIAGGGGSLIAPSEATAYAEAAILTKTANGDGTFNFTVGATGNLGAGVIVEIYDDPTADLDVINAACGTLAQCKALATDGALLAEAGFTGDADEIWRINGVPDNPFALTNIAAGTAIGQYRFGIGLITDNTGRNLQEQDCTPGIDCAGPIGGPPLGDGKVDVIGSGSFLGGCGLPGTSVLPSGSCLNQPINPVDGLFARSDTDFQVAPGNVPEPGSLALFGLGAAFLGFGVRARRSTSA